VSTFSVDTGLLIQPHEALLIDRMQLESHKLRAKFPGFSFYHQPANQKLVGAFGTLTTGYGTSYGILIEIPDTYPYAAPFVWPHGWQLPLNTPHTFGGGRICIMKSEQWNDKFTVAFCVAKTAIWLNKYDYWVRNYRWPGLQQGH
jgi:ubiquitin-protein ligase